jgi:hypothetical protein
MLGLHPPSAFYRRMRSATHYIWAGFILHPPLLCGQLTQRPSQNCTDVSILRPPWHRGPQSPTRLSRGLPPLSPFWHHPQRRTHPCAERDTPKRWDHVGKQDTPHVMHPCDAPMQGNGTHPCDAPIRGNGTHPCDTPMWGGACSIVHVHSKIRSRGPPPTRLAACLGWGQHPQPATGPPIITWSMNWITNWIITWRITWSITWIIALSAAEEAVAAFAARGLGRARHVGNEAAREGRVRLLGAREAPRGRRGAAARRPRCLAARERGLEGLVPRLDALLELRGLVSEAQRLPLRPPPRPSFGPATAPLIADKTTALLLQHPPRTLLRSRNCTAYC